MLIHERESHSVQIKIARHMTNFVENSEPLLVGTDPRAFATRPDAALAIGAVSMEWVNLEEVLGEFIRTLGSRDMQTYVIVTVLDLHDKIKVAKLFGFQRSLSATPQSSLFTRLEQLLNKIDNDLRPARNTVIHQKWVGDGFVDTNARLQRPQSRQRILNVGSKTLMALADIQTLAQRIKLAWAGINEISFESETAWPRSSFDTNFGQLLMEFTLRENQDKA